MLNWVWEWKWASVEVSEDCRCAERRQRWQELLRAQMQECSTEQKAQKMQQKSDRDFWGGVQQQRQIFCEHVWGRSKVAVETLWSASANYRSRGTKATWTEFDKVQECGILRDRIVKNFNANRCMGSPINYWWSAWNMVQRAVITPKIDGQKIVLMSSHFVYFSIIQWVLCFWSKLTE